MPSLVKQDHSSIKFPDSVDESLADSDKVSLLEGWDCTSAAVFSFKTGPQLAVCGVIEPAPGRSGTYLMHSGKKSAPLWGGGIVWEGSFRIVSIDRQGRTRLLSRGSDEGWGDTLIPLLEPQSAGKFRLIAATRDEHAAKYYSVYETTIDCDHDNCVVGKRTCAIDISKNIFPNLLDRVKAEKHTTFASLPDIEHDDPKHPELEPDRPADTPYLDLVTGYSHDLLLRALSGDRQAADVLMMHFPFQLDGAVEEIVDTDRDLYADAKKRGCLGP